MPVETSDLLKGLKELFKKSEGTMEHRNSLLDAFDRLPSEYYSFAPSYQDKTKLSTARASLAIPEDTLHRVNLRVESLHPSTIAQHQAFNFPGTKSQIVYNLNRVTSPSMYNSGAHEITHNLVNQYFPDRKDGIASLRGTRFEQAIQEIARNNAFRKAAEEIDPDSKIALRYGLDTKASRYYNDPGEMAARTIEKEVPIDPAKLADFRNSFHDILTKGLSDTNEEVSRKMPEVAALGKNYIKDYLPSLAAIAGAGTAYGITSPDDQADAASNRAIVEGLYRGTRDPKIPQLYGIRSDAENIIASPSRIADRSLEHSDLVYNMRPRPQVRAIDNPLGAAQFGDAYNASMDIANLYDFRFNPEESLAIARSLHGDTDSYDVRKTTRRLLTGNWDAYEQDDVMRELKRRGWTGNFQFEPTSIQYEDIPELGGIQNRRYQHVFSSFKPEELKIGLPYLNRKDIINPLISAYKEGRQNELSHLFTRGTTVNGVDENERQFSQSLKPMLEDFAPDSHMLDSNYEMKHLFPGQRGDYVSSRRLAMPNESQFNPSSSSTESLQPSSQLPPSSLGKEPAQGQLKYNENTSYADENIYYNTHGKAAIDDFTVAKNILSDQYPSVINILEAVEKLSKLSNAGMINSLPANLKNAVHMQGLYPDKAIPVHAAVKGNLSGNNLGTYSDALKDSQPENAPIKLLDDMSGEEVKEYLDSTGVLPGVHIEELNKLYKKDNLTFGEFKSLLDNYTLIAKNGLPVATPYSIKEADYLSQGRSSSEAKAYYDQLKPGDDAAAKFYADEVKLLDTSLIADQSPTTIGTVLKNIVESYNEFRDKTGTYIQAWPEIKEIINNYKQATAIPASNNEYKTAFKATQNLKSIGIPPAALSKSGHFINQYNFYEQTGTTHLEAKNYIKNLISTIKKEGGESLLVTDDIADVQATVSSLAKNYISTYPKTIPKEAFDLIQQAGDKPVDTKKFLKALGVTAAGAVTLSPTRATATDEFSDTDQDTSNFAKTYNSVDQEALDAGAIRKGAGVIGNAALSAAGAIAKGVWDGITSTGKILEANSWWNDKKVQATGEDYENAAMLWFNNPAAAIAAGAVVNPKEANAGEDTAIKEDAEKRKFLGSENVRNIQRTSQKQESDYEKYAQQFFTDGLIGMGINAAKNKIEERFQ